MAGRPTAAQPPSAAGPPSTAATLPPHVAGHRSGGSKNFGPPTLQLPSDTVVFQTAKIAPSSSRQASAPGSSSAIVASSRGESNGYGSSPREMDHRGGGFAARGRLGAHHHQMRRADYDRSAPPPRRHSGEMMGHPHGPPQPEMPPPRRSRSPQPSVTRERPQERPTPNGRPSQPDAEGEFTHLLLGEEIVVSGQPRGPPADAGAGPSAAPAPRVSRASVAVRRSRPSSADSKGSGSSRGIARMTIRVMKDGDKLGFGIRNDSNRKLKVSTLQNNSTAAKSTLKIGDTILSVNGIDLTGMGFLEVIQQLKATKPGELVFDIERSLDEDDALSGTEGSQLGETMDLDSPLDVAERRFGSSAATRSSPNPPHQQQGPPPQRRPEPPQVSQPPPRTSATPPSAAPPAQQRGPTPPQHERSTQGIPVGMPVDRERMPPAQAPMGDNGTNGGAIEPPRKRPRPAAMTPAQVEMELSRMDKQHRIVLNALTLELRKERTEKANLEEKNTALRKRLQNMLIECDEVRVKANSTVATIKEHAQRDIHELRQALQAARAQLRLQDRGPDVARTDSIVNDLVTTKEQLNRLRKVEMERATNLSNRYSLETRQAEREAGRTRERLIDMFIEQLREAARRNYNNQGARTGGKDSKTNVVVQWEGLRRLAFVKLFGLPCSFDWYSSEDFYSTTLVRHTLPKQGDVSDVFGNTLCHEERAGLFIVASAPMNIAYDPTMEKLTLSCSWIEQNQLRELARNFRF